MRVPFLIGASAYTPVPWMPDRRASTRCDAGTGLTGRFAFLVVFTFERFAPADLDDVEREDFLLRVLRVWAIALLKQLQEL